MEFLIFWTCYMNCLLIFKICLLRMGLSENGYIKCGAEEMNIGFKSNEKWQVFLFMKLLMNLANNILKACCISSFKIYKAKRVTNLFLLFPSKWHDRHGVVINCLHPTSYWNTESEFSVACETFPRILLKIGFDIIDTISKGNISR